MVVQTRLRLSGAKRTSSGTSFGALAGSGTVSWCFETSQIASAVVAQASSLLSCEKARAL